MALATRSPRRPPAGGLQPPGSALAAPSAAPAGTARRSRPRGLAETPAAATPSRGSSQSPRRGQPPRDTTPREHQTLPRRLLLLLFLRTSVSHHSHRLLPTPPWGSHRFRGFWGRPRMSLLNPGPPQRDPHLQEPPSPTRPRPEDEAARRAPCPPEAPQRPPTPHSAPPRYRRGGSRSPRAPPSPTGPSLHRGDPHPVQAPKRRRGLSPSGKGPPMPYRDPPFPL